MSMYQECSACGRIECVCGDYQGGCVKYSEILREFDAFLETPESDIGRKSMENKQDTVPCPECGGSGYLTSEEDRKEFASASGPEFKCRACNGTGRVAEH